MGGGALPAAASSGSSGAEKRETCHTRTGSQQGAEPCRQPWLLLLLNLLACWNILGSWAASVFQKPLYLDPVLHLLPSRWGLTEGQPGPPQGHDLQHLCEAPLPPLEKNDSNACAFMWGGIAGAGRLKANPALMQTWLASYCFLTQAWHPMSLRYKLLQYFL